ncbi:MAG: DUF5330 domain-containing protein [Parvibaculum sp.]
MSFILRAAFWLTVLAFLLPTGGNQATAQNDQTGMVVPTAYDESGAAMPNNDVDAGEMLSLAAQSAGDMMGFCDRNPQVCSRGSAIVAHVARQGSYYGSKAFLWLTEKAQETQKAGPAAKAASTEPRPAPNSHQTGA